MTSVDPRHPYVQILEPYEPPDLEAAAERADMSVDDLIRLIANENPFGLSPCAAAALADFDAYHLHPDYGPLKEAVARHHGVASDAVVLGNGADEMIDLLIRVFVEPGEAIVTCPPTFSMYRFSALVNRCQVLAVPRCDDLSLDVEAIERQIAPKGGRGIDEHTSGEPQVIFLVSPGNPSGRAIPLDVTARLLRLPLLVVVDEAYIAFGGESAISLLPDHDNLVILRTFSKWAGMAGLRLGYAVLNPHLARYLERVRPPYNVNAAAVVAALATFDDLASVQANVSRLIEERERLREALSDIAWLRPLPSQANFLLCRVTDRPAQAVVDRLADAGILVRGFLDQRMAGYIRVTVGRPDQNAALVGALQAMTSVGNGTNDNG